MVDVVHDNMIPCARCGKRISPIMSHMCIGTPDAMLKATIIDNTVKSVREMLDERQGRYGSFDGHSNVSQRLKAVMMTHPKWEAMTYSQKESMEMICHKMARIMNGDPCYRDNWDDIAGYATLVSDELKRAEADDARR